MLRGVIGRRQRTDTWSWKNENRRQDKMCSLEKIRSECFLLIYIYIDTHTLLDTFYFLFLLIIWFVMKFIRISNIFFILS